VREGGQPLFASEAAFRSDKDDSCGCVAAALPCDAVRSPVLGLATCSLVRGRAVRGVVVAQSCTDVPTLMAWRPLWNNPRSGASNPGGDDESVRGVPGARVPSTPPALGGDEHGVLPLLSDSFLGDRDEGAMPLCSKPPPPPPPSSTTGVGGLLEDSGHAARANRLLELLERNTVLLLPELMRGTSQAGGTACKEALNSPSVMSASFDGPLDSAAVKARARDARASSATAAAAVSAILSIWGSLAVRRTICDWCVARCDVNGRAPDKTCVIRSRKQDISGRGGRGPGLKGEWVIGWGGRDKPNRQMQDSHETNKQK
jgi:hypothetical protein